MIGSSPITPINPYTQAASQPSVISADGTDATGTGPTTASGQNIDAVSKDFEAVFLSQMMSAMFEGDDTTAFFGGGTAGDINKSYLLNEYGKAMAQSGGIGIASAVKQELLKMQEVHA